MVKMIYGSVCSGIEAATVAWHPLGWKPAFFSEIEKFPREVLKHHYPAVPLHGDFTTIKEKQYGSIQLLVGGTPCQSFSVAGLRKGLGDDRGNLALEFLRLAQRESPDWILWENVPSVLSSNEGKDFGAFLGGLAELGYGFAYRVLDARYFGVPQERRRVFLVGYFGGWQRAASVLFEQESLYGYPAPIRNEGKGTSCFTPASFGTYRSGCGTLTASGGDIGGGSDNLIVTAIQGNLIGRADENGPNGIGVRDGSMFTLTTTDIHAVQYGFNVRKTTPLENERMQGFPDNYTLIPFRGKAASDGPRYKALGNSMAVPVMRWIGERINMVQNLINEGAI